jgi:Uma2 family endonuclease
MSGMTLTAPPLTVDDYRALPIDGPRWELIDGDMYMLPSPSEFHQSASHILGVILGFHILRQREGAVFQAPFDIFLDNSNAVQPDLIWVGNAKLNQLDQGFHGAPDLVVEILSLSNSMRDLGTKRRLYQKHLVPELWIIDPLKKTVLVDRLEAGGYAPELHLGAEDTLSTPLLPGLEIRLREIFYYPWLEQQ